MLRTDGWTDGRTDNVKTEYPTTNTVCGGYNYIAREKKTHSLDVYYKRKAAFKSVFDYFPVWPVQIIET